ncbi:MAG: SPOR domain-containing protein [Flavobacteriales bacterium]|nr:SPOR domain-containing protein [Flavobacteriales bacterium]
MSLQILTILLSFLFFNTLFAQDTEPIKIDSSEKKITIKVNKESGISEILETNRSSFTVQGYRIQIFSDNKKQPARDEKAKFLSLFNGVKAHEIYQQPYFKIRVGDFRTKIEAHKFLKEVSIHFPNSFIVKDDLEIEQLLPK